MEASAPRDAVFYVCFFGFLAGLVLVVVTGALMRNWVRDNDDDFDPDTWDAVPFIGGVLLLFWSFGRYVQLRRMRGAVLALLCIMGAVAAGGAAWVLEAR